jgi:hypothetical protein
MLNDETLLNHSDLFSTHAAEPDSFAGGRCIMHATIMRIISVHSVAQEATAKSS